MAKSTRNYKNVTTITHNYISEYKTKHGLRNQGESLGEIVNNSLMFEQLGLNNKKVLKLKMLQDMLNKKGNNVTLDGLMDRLIETAFNEVVKVESLDKKAVIEDKTISGLGTARIRINHFIKMVKEHNLNSKHTLKITQTLISGGLTSGKDRIINLDLIKATDKELIVNGSNCNRKAIKRVMMDNNDFNDYNETLSSLSTRSHNIKSIKALEVIKQKAWAK